MKLLQLLLCFMFLIAAISCQPVPEFETAPILSPSPTPIQLSTEPPIPPNSNLDHLVQLAIADLAQRLEMDLNLVNVIEAKSVNWSDTSLGCPQPGMMYAQVQTAGYFIQLEVNGKVYEYHTNMNDTVIPCESTPGEKNPNKDTDQNVQDGWPNQTKDKDVIIVTPTKKP
jgi:hypothetical protein